MLNGLRPKAEQPWRGIRLWLVPNYLHICSSPNVERVAPNYLLTIWENLLLLTRNVWPLLTHERIFRRCPAKFLLCKFIERKILWKFAFFSPHVQN